MKLGKLLEPFIDKKEGIEITEEFKFALDTIQNTTNNIFITGKAGTGKSTFVNLARRTINKKIAVLSPTGLSAINVKGQTIHSFFHFHPRMLTGNLNYTGSDRIYRALDTIIIDEVSMVRADLFDAVDMFLRKHGRDKTKPFGGVQMVLVGDLFQLPPVVTYEEKAIISKLYSSPYFFSSNAYQADPFTLVEFTTIFRQKEDAFINFLNKVRTGDVTQEDLVLINNRVTKDTNDKHVILTTTNKVAQAINEQRLTEIDSRQYVYMAEVEGLFPTKEGSLPMEVELKLKKGARVMFIKNDKGRQWLNGTLGTIKELDEDYIMVKIDEADGGKVVEIGKEQWENVKYEYNNETRGVEEKVLGTIVQYPLRLAWAITIHKSQGMTFNNIVLDFSKSPFAHGQTYVALSRSRTLNGISMSQEIWPNDIIVDEEILNFFK